MATAKKTTTKAPAKAAPKTSIKPAAKGAKAAATRAKPGARRAAKAPARPLAKRAVKPPATASTKQATKRPAKSPPKPPANSPPKSSAKSAGKSSARPGRAARSAKATKPTAATRPAKSAATTPTTPAPKVSTTPHMSSAKTADTTIELPKPKFNKDGLGYTKDFDVAFVKQQYDALQAERVRLTGQALRLEAEAHSLVEEAEMGDVKFDDEGGEGDTMNVERERDLALSAQAREAIEEIDAALLRIAAGTYGYSVVSGRLIPRERLEALPWSSVLVEEKVGGIGRR
jgi:RNA polymerase-binding transcription factor DksA